MAAATASMIESNKKKQDEMESDIISHLPKHILASILSLIPIREAATTSILSKPWRHVWHSIPHLKIDGLIQEGSDDIDRWLAAFYSILRVHRDPVESCYILIPFYAHSDPPFEAHLDNFIILLSEKSIRSLAIVTLRCKIRIPRHAFFLSSLQELMLQNCEVVLPISFTGLPCLRILELLNVSMSDDDFAHMVRSCSALEILEMNEYTAERNFRIDAPNLVHLKFRGTRTKDISLENVPLLAHACFKVLYNMSSYEAWDGDTDEINSLVNLMMQLDNVETLSMEFDYPAKVFPSEHMPQMLPAQHQLKKLKKLHLEIPFFDSQGLLLCLFLLRSCPILEEFSLWVRCREVYPDDEIDHLEDQAPLECLTHHLTTIYIHYPHPNPEYLLFIKYLLMNTYVLKRMVMKYQLQDPEVAGSIIKELESLQRASPNAALLFSSI